MGTPSQPFIDLLCKFGTVIYLGSNTDGTACGDSNFFHHLLTRDVLLEHRYRRNSLTVYGDIRCLDRPLTLEEFCFFIGKSLDFDTAVSECERRKVTVFNLTEEILKDMDDEVRFDPLPPTGT